MNKELIKRIIFWIFFIIGILFTILVIFAIFFPEKYADNTVIFNFFIVETNESIDGSVYLNYGFLGETSNGLLIVNRSDVYPGDISIKGTFHNKNFTYFFKYTKELYNSSHTEFILNESNIKELEFNSNSINTKLVENEIFNAINRERIKRGLFPLKRNKVLDNLAKEYSHRMADENFFSHEDPQGKKLHDRMNEKKIFNFVATEDISYGPIRADTNLSEDVVMGWIESPGHRIPILDEERNKSGMWNSIGIGVICIDNNEISIPYCYSTAEFASFDAEYSIKLNNNYLTMIELYPTGLGLTFETKISIDFVSSGYVDLILVPNKSQFDKIIKLEDYDQLFKKNDIKKYSDTISLKPGYTLVVQAKENADFTIKLEYNPD